MEIPIGMVLLSHLLKFRANRWTNIISGAIMTVVQTMTMFFGKPAPYYIFCSTIEILTTAFIVWYAWKWVDSISPRVNSTITK
jgi:TRAP-type C4-dicarboxylate transport system permease small subunit